MAELYDGNYVEQQHQRAECERYRDRSCAAAALLLFREDDALLAIVFHAGIRLPTTGCAPERPTGRRSAARRTTKRDKGSKSRTAAWRPDGRYRPRPAERSPPPTAPSRRRPQPRPRRKSSRHNLTATVRRRSALGQPNKSVSAAVFPDSRQRRGASGCRRGHNPPPATATAPRNAAASRRR